MHDRQCKVRVCKRFCLVVEIAQGGFVTNRATLSTFMFTSHPSFCVSQRSLELAPWELGETERPCVHITSTGKRMQ